MSVEELIEDLKDNYVLKEDLENVGFEYYSNHIYEWFTHEETNDLFYAFNKYSNDNGDEVLKYYATFD